MQKGFGEQESPELQQNIEKYFDQFGYKVNAVRLRRKDDPKQTDGNRKGSFKVCSLQIAPAEVQS